MSTQALFEENGLALALLGMAVVFIALSILIFVVAALPRLIALMEGRKRRSDITAGRAEGSGAAPPLAYAPSPISSTGRKPVGDDGLPPELIAVLAAAAEYELGPVRIVRTRPLTSSELAWTLEGRLRHHASHRLQPRNR